MDKAKRPKILIGVTGATGMLFLSGFLECLKDIDVTVHGICSDSGADVLKMELGIGYQQLPVFSKWFDVRDVGASPASGSADYKSMVVLPCTMGSLAAIASGLTINLIHRAADVMLKERRTLVLAVRETPLNRTHLQNMLTVHDAGAVICPPMPSFYLKPKSLEEAARTYAWRLADQLGIEIKERKRWENG
ncbi:UbiX family flavin prenyltransferase [Desulforhopalus singaporensis]|uniref:Flavin prenyltransferase UbiX n=1 Tax=Desulforhopalus singaporensis TaxID=91360 RepID=A0A1H0PCK2_9BACT|nr:UbiX family flavin prenyltransferase [Desulforhopalus singaporensis]SDP02490.1 4-hydroxy-3-polyprenylbenzoate decarboxylase [Desulforhopalus singaporensis]